VSEICVSVIGRTPVVYIPGARWMSRGMLLPTMFLTLTAQATICNVNSPATPLLVM
jgi:hypothetical protein